MSKHVIGKYELDGSELDVLFKLFWFGHQDDGDLPSKGGMSGLIQKELAVKDYTASRPNFLNEEGMLLAARHYLNERESSSDE